MKRTLTLAALITLGMGAIAPLTASAQTDLRVVINTAPPTPRFESAPPARSGYVWAPGYWNWEQNRHVWSAGHWERARDGYRYERAEWQHDGDAYRLRQGGWHSIAVRDDDPRDSYRNDNRGYDIRVAPPAARYERAPRARNGYVWEPGRWEWRANRYEWVGGVWIRERHGYAYAPASWVERDGRWAMEPSRWWTRHGGRDHDRDGIPDAYDHDRDNDGVRNHRDHDRDGDGVPNEVDRRPDNPRRY
jgi:hypothetical protein